MSTRTSESGADLALQVREILDTKTHLREMLFPFGFLMTSAAVDVPSEGFPFYAKWPGLDVGGYRLHHHPDQKIFSLDSDLGTLFLIGHAYDPVGLIHDEAQILQVLRDAREVSEAKYTDALNRLTGLYVIGVVDGDTFTLYGDATGMQTVFYGKVKNRPYVTSHAALVGAICGLTISEYVKRLTQYRFYHLFGRALPGDLSPYDELRRLVPNHLARWDGQDFEIRRFFPVEPILASDAESNYAGAVKTATDILRNSMAIAAKKWDMPAISLTGGCDSQTTLACVVGNYERFRYFSYVSSPEEQADAAAAQVIAQSLGLQHELIPIHTDEVQQHGDFFAIATILELNYGGIGPANPREVAKRIQLRKVDIQLEIKSSISEIARCYYHKRFSKRRFPGRPSARYLTTLYKVFVHDRDLVRLTDEVCQDYLERYCSDGSFDHVDWWDIIFWEFRVGAWNGPMITGDHRFSFDIDIPYNNRLLLGALLTTPIEARIADQPHRDMRDLANPEINLVGVSVVNVKHTKNRARAERAYLEIHSRLPF